MKESIRRSRREHAATLAASVRRTLDRDSGGSSEGGSSEGGSSEGGSSAPAEPETPGRGRLVPAAVALMALAGLVAAVLVPRLADEAAVLDPEPVGTFEIVRGLAAVRSAGSPSDGTPILAGTWIETSASGGARTAFRLADKASVRLDADTRLEVTSGSVLTLERGAVYIDAASVGTAVEVRTTLGVVRDIGTRFEVRRTGEEALRVRVREGAIVLESGGDSYEAGLGEELAVEHGGPVVRGTVPIYGAHWDWVVESAPLPEIEGRPLREFLDWVAREGGWTLRFADEETASRVSAIVLHGNVRDSALMEAAEMLVRSSGLSYRLDGGNLVVTPLP